MKIIIPILLVPLFFISFAQQSVNDSALDLMRTEILKNNKNTKFQDLKELFISNQTTCLQSSVRHTYARQYYNGIEIYNAESSIHLLEGEVIQVNDKFEPYLAARVNSTIPGLTSIAALHRLVAENNYQPTAPFESIKAPTTNNQEQVISNGGISKETIPAKLVYFASENGQLRLSWQVTITEKESRDRWSFIVDAHTGKILERSNNIPSYEQWNVSQTVSQNK